MRLRAPLIASILAAILTLLLHSILFYTAEGHPGQSIMFGVGILFFLIVLSVAGIRHIRMQSKEGLNFRSEWKRAMQFISMYAVLAGLSQIIYFNTIDKDYYGDKIKAGMNSASQMDLQNLPDDNPAKTMDREAFMSKQRALLEGVYSNKFVVPSTILAILIAGVFYSLCIVLLFRRIPMLSHFFYRK